MPDSNAIKAGEAFVELTTKNNVGPGVAGAKRDIASLTGATSAAATAQLTDAGKVRVAQEQAQGQLGKYSDKFLKVAAVIGIVKLAYGQMQEKANAVLDEQIERMGKLGDKGRELFEKRKGEVDARLGFGSPVDQLAATKKAAADAEKELLGKNQNLTAARKALDDFKAGNKMVSFTGDVRLLEKTDNPFGGLDYTTAEKKRRESTLAEATKDFEQAQKSAEGYRKSLRDMADGLSTSVEFQGKLNALRQSTAQIGSDPERVYLDGLKQLAAVAPRAAGAVQMYAAKLTENRQKGFTNDLAELTRAWDIQRQTIGQTAEQLEVFQKRADFLKHNPGMEGWADKVLGPAKAAADAMKAVHADSKLFDLTKQWKDAATTMGLSAETAEMVLAKGEGASRNFLANARAAAVVLTNSRAEQAKKDIDDEMEEKRRLAAAAVSGGSKGGFGTSLGAGSFDYGGGGPWAGIGVTLKDMRDADLRKEKIDIDRNKILEEIKRRTGDVAQ